MDRRGEIGDLDRQINTLMQREKLTEEEVKALCEKVGACESGLSRCCLLAASPSGRASLLMCTTF